MKRFSAVAMLALASLATLAAQAPKGWKMRVDRSPSASDPDAPGDIKFVIMGTGFHATNPQAAVYWNPANTAPWRLYPEGHFHADEAQRPHQLLRPDVRRQRAGGRASRATCISWSRRTGRG